MSRRTYRIVLIVYLDITLMAPVLSLLAEYPGEIGCVCVASCGVMWRQSVLTSIGRSRMGLCFTISGIGSLIGKPFLSTSSGNSDDFVFPHGPIGTPIAGALLTSKYLWWRPVVFSGVSDRHRLTQPNRSVLTLVPGCLCRWHCVLHCRLCIAASTEKAALEPRMPCYLGPKAR